MPPEAGRPAGAAPLRRRLARRDHTAPPGGPPTELGRSRGLRFVGPQRWHVTLRFLGKAVDPEPIAQALAACGAAVTDPLECRLGPGTDWFTAVRVLQLPATGLDDLARTVRAATVDLVPAPWGEPPFNGHLTLARSKGRRLSVAALGEMAGVPFEASFPVRHVDLVASDPSPDGHVYTTLARAKLGVGPA